MHRKKKFFFFSFFFSEKRPTVFHVLRIVITVVVVDLWDDGVLFLKDLGQLYGHLVDGVLPGVVTHAVAPDEANLSSKVGCRVVLTRLEFALDRTQIHRVFDNLTP